VQKKIAGIIVCILVFTTFAGAMSPTNTSTKSVDSEPVDRAYSHTILAEFGTYTTSILLCYTRV